MKQRIGLTILRASISLLFFAPGASDELDAWNPKHLFLEDSDAISKEKAYKNLEQESVNAILPIIDWLEAHNEEEDEEYLSKLKKLDEAFDIWIPVIKKMTMLTREYVADARQTYSRIPASSPKAPKAQELFSQALRNQHILERALIAFGEAREQKRFDLLKEITIGMAQASIDIDPKYHSACKQLFSGFVLIDEAPMVVGTRTSYTWLAGLLPDRDFSIEDFTQKEGVHQSNGAYLHTVPLNAESKMTISSSSPAFVWKSPTENVSAYMFPNLDKSHIVIIDEQAETRSSKGYIDDLLASALASLKDSSEDLHQAVFTGLDSVPSCPDLLPSYALGISYPDRAVGNDGWLELKPHENMALFEQGLTQIVVLESLGIAPTLDGMRLIDTGNLDEIPLNKEVPFQLHIEKL